MSDYMLNIPEEVIEAARQIANATSRPVEEILLTRLKTVLPLPVLPPDEEGELEALHHLSDDALWTFAREQLPEDVKSQMQSLMDKNSSGNISSNERQTLESLVERSERLMLRKSEAAAVLTRRGYTVTPADMAVRG